MLENSKRGIKSYTLRQGRITVAQNRAVQELLSYYAVDPNHLSEKVILDIGFGMGDALMEQALAAPDSQFIGVEVHTPGVGHLLNGLKEQGIHNVRVFHGDVKALLTLLPEASLSGVQIFFPDPWPKKRHHKRRLVQEEFIALLVQKLKVGGTIHCATDWQPYAEHMLHVLGATPKLYNQAQAGPYADRGLRPLTKFEARGLKLGHQVFDLVFSYTAQLYTV